MDRKIFKISFKRDGITKLPCPSCHNGILRVKKDNFVAKETSDSQEDHAGRYWDPYLVRYKFSCIFICTSCEEIVAATGSGEVEGDYFLDDRGHSELDYEDYFRPEYFTPHLVPFMCPKETPELVENELNKSFALMLADPAAAANHVRISLEHLLTALKIRRFETNGSKKSPLSLHKRIDSLQEKYPDIKDLFLAIKWIGNAGSHSSREVTVDDVFDAYELMEELLKEIYSKKAKQKIKALAKSINKKKGPK